MSSGHSTPKLRPQRLRASCDGCFLAKVKCSKTRPICSRCLTCGTDCKYSPSSRAGKPRADATRARQASRNGSVGSSAASEDGGTAALQFTSQPTSTPVNPTASPLTYNLEANWPTPSGSSEGEIGRRSISANNTPMISEGSLESEEMVQCANELFNSSFEWNTSATHGQLSTPFQSDHNVPYPLPPRSQSLADVRLPQPLPQWFEDSHDLINIPPHQGFSNSSPFMPPYQQTATPPFDTHPKLPPACTSCNCFTTCLQSLQALHNASSTPSSSTSMHTSPPFDLVLTVNRKAVSSCASLLSCRKCLSRAGSTTTTMLLATIIGKIMSFYRSAAKSYFGSSFNFSSSRDGDITGNPTGVGVGSGGGLSTPITVGRYFVTGEEGRWLEMEILGRELRKLEGLCGRFGEVCARGDGDEEGIEGAVLGYLGRSLQVTFEILKIQDGCRSMGEG